MARLIDTDDLKFPNIAIFDMKLHGVYVPMVRLFDVQELIPTVDAIPVGWLNELHRKCCENGETDLMDAITVLINEYHVWQEGQEEK